MVLPLCVRSPRNWSTLEDLRSSTQADQQLSESFAAKSSIEPKEGRLAKPARWRLLASDANKHWSDFQQHDMSAEEHLKSAAENIRYAAGQRVLAKVALIAAVACVLEIDNLPKPERKKAKNDLAMSPADYSRLLRQGQNAAIADPKNQLNLPDSPYTRYVLSEPPAETVQGAIDAGVIHPTMTRLEASDWIQQYRDGCDASSKENLVKAPRNRAMPYCTLCFDGPATSFGQQCVDDAIAQLQAATKDVPHFKVRFPHQEAATKYQKEKAVWQQKVQKFKRAAGVALTAEHLKPLLLGRPWAVPKKAYLESKGINQEDFALPDIPTDDQIKHVLHALGRADMFETIERDALAKHHPPKTALIPSLPTVIHTTTPTSEAPRRTRRSGRNRCDAKRTSGRAA